MSFWTSGLSCSGREQLSYIPRLAVVSQGPPPAGDRQVPVLFLDLNDDLLTPSDNNPVEAVSTGPLFGEKEDMIDLPIIKRDEHTVSQPTLSTNTGIDSMSVCTESTPSHCILGLHSS